MTPQTFHSAAEGFASVFSTNQSIGLVVTFIAAVGWSLFALREMIPGRSVWVWTQLRANRYGQLAFGLFACVFLFFQSLLPSDGSAILWLGYITAFFAGAFAGLNWKIWTLNQSAPSV